MARDPRELRAARRRARASALGRERVAERQTRRARAIRREYEQRYPPVDGGGISQRQLLDQLAREIHAKPCDAAKNGRFDGLPKYSRTAVRRNIESMSEYERDLARRISSADYRARASTQGHFNAWWYHSSKMRRTE